jgi:hypothetical protein
VKNGLIVVILSLFLMPASSISAPLSHWKKEWPKTDFSKHSIPLDEIMSGGPPKDGIPSLDDPKFKPVSEIKNLAETEPVITLDYKGDVRAYPVRILMFHEIVNDTVAKEPVLITYCPLCNTAIVFKRVVEGKATEFGTTGNLRHSDLLMYDRLTESWWQQFTGKAIVGEMMGTELEFLPSRLEAFSMFKKRYPKGKVLIASSTERPYGKNPYVGYDRSKFPMLYQGKYEGNLPPLARVVAVKNKAWSMALLREKKKIVEGDLTLTWSKGQNSALDAQDISKGRDVGNVVVQRKTSQGYEDVVHVVTFAFAFKAFHPHSKIIGEEE